MRKRTAGEGGGGETDLRRTAGPSAGHDMSCPYEDPVRG